MKNTEFYKKVFGKENRIMNQILFSTLIGNIFIFLCYYRFDDTFALLFNEVLIISTYLPILMVMLFNSVMSNKVINKFEDTDLYEYYKIYIKNIGNNRIFLFNELLKNILIYFSCFMLLYFIFETEISYVYTLFFDITNIVLFFFLNILVLRFKLPSQAYYIISIIEAAFITSSISEFEFSITYEISKIIIIIVAYVFLYLYLKGKEYKRIEMEF